MDPLRVTVLIDGFNFFHSIEDAIRDGHAEKDAKWFDYRSLSQSFLAQIEVPGRKEIVGIEYFSALAHHKTNTDAHHVSRHQTYVKALTHHEVKCHLHRFKSKKRSCRGCSGKLVFYEEKETDVAIAVRLLQLFVQEETDIAIIVTGDTDIGPAVKTVQSMFASAIVWFAFPYKRKNNELADLVKSRGGAFRIHPKSYMQHRLAEAITLKNRRVITIPDKWKIVRASPVPPAETDIPSFQEVELPFNGLLPIRAEKGQRPKS